MTTDPDRTPLHPTPGQGHRASRRVRIARRILRLRQDVRRYRRLSLGLGVAALCLALAVVGTGASGGSGVEGQGVELGKGVAGVEPAASIEIERTPSDAGRGADAVELPADLAPPPAPPQRQVAGEPLVRKLLGEGAASYYHDALEGRSTASGQPYRGEALTAAHRSLPFGSRVRVTNLANGRSVVVRINDRGPFARHRVIDLSRAAARQLGLLARGHGRVRMELLE